MRTSFLQSNKVQFLEDAAHSIIPSAAAAEGCVPCIVCVCVEAPGITGVKRHTRVCALLCACVEALCISGVSNTQGCVPCCVRVLRHHASLVLAQRPFLGQRSPEKVKSRPKTVKLAIL